MVLHAMFERRGEAEEGGECGDVDVGPLRHLEKHNGVVRDHGGIRQVQGDQLIPDRHTTGFGHSAIPG